MADLLLFPIVSVGFLASQVFAVIAIGLSVAGFFLKDRLKVLIFQSLSCIAEICSYVFLGEVFGSIGLIVASVRTIIFTVCEFLHKPVGKWVVGIIIAATAVFFFLFFKSASDVLFFVGLNVYTLSLYSKDLKKMKMGLIAANLLYLIANVLLYSPFGAVSKVVNIAALIVALVYENKKPNYEKKPNSVKN